MHSSPDYISTSRLDKPRVKDLLRSHGCKVTPMRSFRQSSVSRGGNDELTYRQEANLLLSENHLQHLCRIFVESIISRKQWTWPQKSKLRICLSSIASRSGPLKNADAPQHWEKIAVSAKNIHFEGDREDQCETMLPGTHRERSSPLRCCDEWTTHRRWSVGSTKFLLDARSDK
jgi:hypothetical protein